MKESNSPFLPFMTRIRLLEDDVRSLREKLVYLRDTILSLQEQIDNQSRKLELILDISQVLHPSLSNQERLAHLNKLKDYREPDRER